MYWNAFPNPDPINQSRHAYAGQTSWGRPAFWYKWYTVRINHHRAKSFPLHRSGESHRNMGRCYTVPTVIELIQSGSNRWSMLRGHKCSPGFDGTLEEWLFPLVIIWSYDEEAALESLYLENRWWIDIFLLLHEWRFELGVAGQPLDLGKVFPRG